MSATRQSIIDAALNSFNLVGYEATTVAAICQISGSSNGSFFHHFGSKEGLAGSIFLAGLSSYHAALVEKLHSCNQASKGIANLIGAHVSWVVEHRAKARFMFEHVRNEWLTPIKAEQQAQNFVLAEAIEAWRRPLIEKGELANISPLTFFSQVIGPAQLLCRIWLTSKADADPMQQIEFFANCAIRALVTPSQTTRKRTQS